MSRVAKPTRLTKNGQLQPSIGGLFIFERTSGALSLIGTSVWTGRALQAKYDDLEIIGLAHLYLAL